MYDATAHFSIRQTYQQQPVPGRTDQVKGDAGGFVFAVTDWTRLDRFLVLGAEGGTYYASEQRLTRENAEAVVRCIKEDGLRAVARIVEISDRGRAPKNDPALFALAMCFGLGDLPTRRAAADALPKVARIGTHLFHFAEYMQAFRGWGRVAKRAVANWYQGQDAERLANQVVKYRQRDGWTHRDLLRLSHPETAGERAAVLEWAAHSDREIAGLPRLIEGAIALGKTEDAKEAARLIREYSLPRECVPTELLNDVEVWKALLADMPLGAMVRNLGKMTAIGAVKPMSEELLAVVSAFGDGRTLRLSRLHPIAILLAQKVYAQGHGDKGKLSWSPIGQIVDALDEAFYATFQNVKPTGKRIMLALDVSGSMGSSYIAGTTLTAREGAAAMALVTAATEPNHCIVGFTAAGHGSWKTRSRPSAGPWGMMRGHPSDSGDGISPLPISPKQRLADVVRSISEIPFGATDCALPMLYALEKGIEVDAFVIYTDNETWHGHIHAFQALRQYRECTGIPATLAVVGMTSNGFTVADPTDAGMMDLVGFDTATPEVLRGFIAGE